MTDSAPLAAGAPPAPRLRRARLREGRAGLAVAVLLAAIFTLWPDLDLRVSAAFDPDGTGFTGDHWAWVRVVYRGIPVTGWLYAGAGLVAMLAWWRTGSTGWRWLARLGARWRRSAAGAGPDSRRLARALWRSGGLGHRWTRRLAALGWVSLLASGLLINAGLKETWGRARPVQVTQFGGSHRFSPALEPAAECRHNCSFVSGHAASGFVLMSVGLMGSVATRRRWRLVGLAWGGVVSLARIMEGGHFLSDTLFAGLVIWATGWGVREVWLRLAARRRRALRAGS